MKQRRSRVRPAEETRPAPIVRSLPPPLGGSPAPVAPPGGGRGRASGGRLAPDPAPPPEPMRVIEILSHELRSPITTIHLGTKVLREQGARIAKPVREEVVEAVEEEAERLYRLVEDLLALGHWLPGVVAAEVHAYPRLKVRASVPPDLPPVLADDGALQQVMRNLLANAVRYAPEGMPVEIISRPPGDGHVTLEVLDRGPGIDEDEADRLFDPFYRSAAANALGSGAGLGLAAARRLMHAMDGTIDAEPRQGGGARFVLTLPLATLETEEA